MDPYNADLVPEVPSLGPPVEIDEAPTVRLELDADAFAPGARLDGRVSAAHGVATPVTVAVGVGWWTEGRGETDEDWSNEVTLLDAAPLTGGWAERFSLTLPSLPWSYGGGLVAVRWAVRVWLEIDEEAAEMVERPITVHPSAVR